MPGAILDALDGMDDHGIVFDMVYAPAGNRSAAARGERSACESVDGLDMLIGQAAPAFALFFGAAGAARPRRRAARGADVMTIILGLTGSIGMGKSTVARMFADEGVPVFDADAAVHRLQGPAGALVAEIEAAFPGTTGPEGVNRSTLAERVLAEPAALQRLEALVHPAVALERGGVPRRSCRCAGGRARHPPAVRERRRRRWSTRSRWSRRDPKRCSACARWRGPA